MYIRRLLSLVSLLLNLSVAPGAQQPMQRGTQILNGFAKELSGEHIDYHSFHPYATAALLTRCLDGKRTISWQTDPLPPDGSGDYATFAWIAAHSTGTSSADAQFHVSLNGQRWFTFTTIKEKRVRQWKVDGKDGASLTFDARWEDTVNDLFGYLFLRVPVRDFPKGQPLTISIVGDSAASRDWYMTFKYALKESTAVQVQPALMRTPAGEQQLVDVVIDHVEPEGSVEISLPGREPMKSSLSLGFNRIQFSVDPVKETKQVDLAVAVSGWPVKHETVILHPVTYREFWLLPHSHNDIGYSDLQADVEKKQLKNLRDAVQLFKKTATYPPEARFKWNTEILWAVDRFLATCSATEKREFIDAVRQGGIGLNALYTNQLTGICRPEELFRLTDFARYLANTFGLTINNALITDIPGFTWATVPALARGGIRYFSSGPNYIPSMNDGGDRVGYFNRAWGDRPFYWVSPSGEEKVLFWVAGKGYSWFHGWIAGRAGGSTATQLFDYLRELEGKHYSYDMVQLRYTIVADNGPTDPDLPDFVKTWNEKYASPKLVIATAQQMFEEFERRWGQSLPSFAGDITPYWEDGALSTLKELGITRRASERLVQTEILSAIRATLTAIRATYRPPRSIFDDAWKNVNLFDEHTWGAWNSVSDPDNPFAVSQWRVKQQYALDLDRQSKELLYTFLEPENNGTVFDIINTSSWPRTDLVVLTKEQSTGGELVVDAAGKPVASQRLSTGELAFRAEAVPPLGARRYFVKKGSAAGGGAVGVRETELSNGLLSLAIDPGTGAIRSLRVTSGMEFVDASKLSGLNQYLYVPGKSPAGAKSARLTKIETKEKGPLVGTLRLALDAPGCNSLTQEISVIDGIARVDIVNVMDKTKVREKEAVHIAFPLRVPEGVFRLDGSWGIVRPTADQLPGSCKDFLSTGRWLDVSNQDCGVTWTTVESPLVEIGAMTDETPDSKGYRVWRTAVPPGTTFYSYAINNYWHTNYTADQEGVSTLHYALFPHGAFNAANAYRAGVEQNQPLLVRQSQEDDALSGSMFSISSPGVVVSSVLPSADRKALMVRLFNAGGRPDNFRIEWGTLKPKKVFYSSLYETEDAEAGKELSLPAFGILTLRCEL